MAIYLKKFENHTQHDNYINGSDAILPNVSICTTEGDVHYNPILDPLYVDLGLPSGTKWAKYNVGASTPEEEGFFFSWGNVTGRNLNGTGSYDFGTDNSTEPYVSSSGATITYPGRIPIGDAYDMARANMGAPWRLPTDTEFKELYDNTDSEWTTINGVAGRKFMKKSDHSVYVFFPAAGFYNGSSHYNGGSNGYYWSSVLFSADSAYYLFFSSSGVSPQYGSNRHVGISVRAVQ